MDARASWSVAGVLTTLLLAAFASVQRAPEAERSPALERGRAIYTTGRSPRALAIEARIVGGERVPALAFPCVQCHLEDGRGAVEGGRIVAPITRAALSRPGARRPGGEPPRPAYDSLAVARAIQQGLDSAGRELDLSMPRYALDPRDLADLLAYLDVLATEPAPGCDSDSVRIGTLLPLGGPHAGRGRALARLIEAAFQTWNGSGGIHGRRLELVAADAGDSLEAARSAARRLLEEDGGVLCVVAPSDMGAHPDLLAELDGRGVPVIGPLCVAPDDSQPGAVFWNLTSLADQSRALARFVASSANESIGLAGDGSAGAKDMTRALDAELRSLGVEARTDAPLELARGARPEWLVCFGELAWTERVLAELRSTDWRPRLCFASVLLGGAPRAAGFRFELLAPAVGPGWSAGEERFEALRARIATADGREDLVAWRAAFAATELLAQGLRASGREPSRERLVAELERVRRLETGVLPPLSFGPASRVGTHASLIVSHDERGALAAVQLVEPAPATASIAEAVR